jgi:phosphate starvation-inducible membrane PsiE
MFKLIKLKQNNLVIFFKKKHKYKINGFVLIFFFLYIEFICLNYLFITEKF